MDDRGPTAVTKRESIETQAIIITTYYVVPMHKVEPSQYWSVFEVRTVLGLGILELTTSQSLASGYTVP